MGDFGFDPNIILANLTPQPRQPNINETLQTLSELAQRRAQTGELQYKQQRERTLADLVSQNANRFADPVAQSFARGGFGAEAQDAQDAASKLIALHRQVLQSQAAAIKTPDEGTKWLARIPAEDKARLGLPEAYDADAIKTWVAGSISPEKQAEQEAQRQHHADEKEHWDQDNWKPLVQKDMYGNVRTVGFFNTKTAERISLDGSPAAGGAPAATKPGAGGRASTAPAQGKTATPKPADTGLPPLPPGLVAGVAQGVAEYYNQSGGKFPEGFRLPRGNAAVPYSNYIIALANKIKGEGGPSLIETRTGLEADRKSLDETQKLVDAVDANEAKALKEVDLYKKKLAGLWDSGNPLANKPLRWFQENIKADPAYSGILTAGEALGKQMERVLSLGSSSGALPVSVVAEGHKLIDSGTATIPALAEKLETLVQEMHRSNESNRERLAKIKGRISSSGKAAAPASQAPADNAGGAKPDIRARIAQLRQHGAQPAEIKAVLAKEYTTDEIKAAASK